MSARAEQAAAWMYKGIWGVLTEWFRVPAQPPTLPVSNGEFIQSFQPAAGFLKYMMFWFWLVLAITDIVLAIGYVAAAVALSIAGYWWIALLLLPVALFVIIAPDIVAFIAIHLRYDTTWYVMTDRSLRIRRGIWVIHETTITFENVQNLKVQQGPLQRHYGISNLVVETAGAGGDHHQKNNTGVSNRGIIEGIADAHAVRDRILQRMRQSTSAGLGDESQLESSAANASPAWTPAHVEALRAIREEVRLMCAS